MKILITTVCILFTCACVGQQLSYRPKNPNFGGGDTFMYQQLLASANAQNSFTDPSAEDRDRTELEEFAANLNRQILGQLSRSLFTSQLGEGLEEGSFSFGSLSLEIFDSAEGLVINILDTNTGEQTQIIVPN